jgi:hypothetical protein
MRTSAGCVEAEDEHDDRSHDAHGRRPELMEQRLIKWQAPAQPQDDEARSSSWGQQETDAVTGDVSPRRSLWSEVGELLLDFLRALFLIVFVRVFSQGLGSVEVEWKDEVARISVTYGGPSQSLVRGPSQSLVRGWTRREIDGSGRVEREGGGGGVSAAEDGRGRLEATSGATAASGEARRRRGGEAADGGEHH